MQKSQDKEIRLRVLEKLKELHGDAVEVDCGTIAAACEISNEDLERYINYLEEKRFIKFTYRKIPVKFSRVKLSADGIDYLEEGFKSSVPQIPSISSSGINTFWNLLHPEIIKVSKSRFEAGHFADSVEAAFKEINTIVKDIVKQKTGQEFDGADLMNKAFSVNQPIIKLDDISTETGKNIQKGYMQIFSGAMTGIRNPKTHGNIEITHERSIHFLFLASL